MFTVDVSGHSYKVSFQHEDEEIIFGNAKSNKQTWCYIYDLGDMDTDYNSLVGVGLACCSIKDNFDKNKGRKISLALALKEAGFNGYEREVFWKGYFKAHGKVD